MKKTLKQRLLRALLWESIRIATIILLVFTYLKLHGAESWWSFLFLLGAGLAGGWFWYGLNKLSSTDSEVYDLVVPAAGLPGAAVGIFIIARSTELHQITHGVAGWVDWKFLALAGGWVVMCLVAAGFWLRTVQAKVRAVPSANEPNSGK